MAQFIMDCGKMVKCMEEASSNIQISKYTLVNFSKANDLELELFQNPQEKRSKAIGSKTKFLLKTALNSTILPL